MIALWPDLTSFFLLPSTISSTKNYLTSSDPHPGKLIAYSLRYGSGPLVPTVAVEEGKKKKEGRREGGKE